MLDINFIREHVEQIKTAAEQKNIKIDLDRLLVVDDLRELITA